MASNGRVRDLEDEVERLRRGVVAAPLDDMHREYEQEIARMRSMRTTRVRSQGSGATQSSP